MSPSLTCPALHLQLWEQLENQSRASDHQDVKTHSGLNDIDHSGERAQVEPV